MVILHRIILCSLITIQLFLISASGIAQKDDPDFKAVRKLFKSEDYDLAIPQLISLNEMYPNRAGLNFMLGYAYFNTCNEKYKAISWFEASKSHAGPGTIAPDNFDSVSYYVFHLLGEVYYMQGNFQRAYTNYYIANKLLPYNLAKTSGMKFEKIKHYNILIKDIYPYQVEKLEIINEEVYSERSPVVLGGYIESSIKNSVLLYQSNQNSERFGINNTTWKSKLYNMVENDRLVDIQPELLPVISYQQSVIFKQKINGYYDLFKGDYIDDKIQNIVPLTMVNEAKSNETSLVIINEGTILFTSDRKGGHGGFDIWKVKKGSGKWGKPENLGSIINTNFNENFISAYGNTFYMSSDRPGGFGQYDLYYSYLDGDKPSYANLFEYPANSSGNDVDVKQFNDDLILFASDRGAKDYDIFYIDKSIPVKEYKIIGEIPEEFLSKEEGMYNDAILFDNLVNQIQNSDIATAVTTIDEMETTQAIQVVSDLELEQAVEIMENIERDKAIEIIDGMEIEKAIDIVDAMSYSTSVDVIGAVNEITSIQIIQEMETQKAAALLDQVDLEKASKILEGMEVEKAVDIVDEFVTEKTIEIIDHMDSESAARIVGEFSDEKAIKIIEGVEVEKAVGVLGSMDEAKSKRIVDQFKAEMEEGSENDKIIAIIKSYFRDQVRIKESVIFKIVYFDFNSSELLFLTRKELIMLIDFMKENPSIKIEVVGHTDHIGDWDINLQFSHDRALEVFKFLRNNNIERERIIFYGKGPAQPVESNQFAEGRQMNRRVEVILLQ